MESFSSNAEIKPFPACIVTSFFIDRLEKFVTENI